MNVSRFSLSVSLTPKVSLFQNNDRIVAGTRLLSNQRGYVHEVSEDYRPDLAFALQG